MTSLMTKPFPSTSREETLRAVPPATIAPRVDDKPIERPRSLRAKPTADRLDFYGAAAGSLAVAWLLYERILPFSGVLGFVIVWFALFVAAYALLTSISNPGPAVKDRIAGSLIQGGAALVAISLVSAVVYTIGRGEAALSHANTFTQNGAGIGPLTPLNRGGVTHAILGSLLEIGIATVIALPLGVGTAIYMTEIGGRLSKIVRTVVEAMTALPSIVAALFIYTVWILDLGKERSGFAGALAITVMILPIIARASDVVLRVVPSGLREASLALGASRWQTVWRVVLPTARPGLATALILGVARGVGETSPVLLTSGASTYTNTNPFHNPMNSLPLYIYNAVRSGNNLLIERGFGAATILLLVVLILFITARYLARPRASRG